MPAKYKKRADGRYCTHVLIGMDSDGKRQRKTVYSKTIRGLEEKAAELRRQVGLGTVTKDDGITVGEWADLWLNTYKAGVEYNTAKMYKFIVENYVKKFLGAMKLKDVKTMHLQRIINENRDKAGIVKKFGLTINQIFEQATMNDIVAKNPAKGMSFPSVQRDTGKRALTEEEIEKIKSLPLDAKTKCFVFLLLYTGMRKSEALALTKGDIDREIMEITINKALVFGTNRSSVKDTAKTPAGNRVVRILAPLKDALFSHMDRLETDLLFATSSGGTFTGTAYRRMWEKFERAMGTKEITAHIFRHNFATMLYNADVDVKAAQSMLGHKNIQVTLDIYTHLGKAKMEGAMEKLEAYVSGGREVVTN